MSKFIVSGVCPHGAVETFETDQGERAFAKFAEMSAEPNLVFVVALRTDSDGTPDVKSQVLGIRVLSEDTQNFRKQLKKLFSELGTIDPNVNSALADVLTRIEQAGPAPSNTADVDTLAVNDPLPVNLRN